MGKFNRGFSSLSQTRYFRSQPENEARRRRTNRVITRVILPGLIAGAAFIGVDLYKRFHGPAQDPKPAPTDVTPTPATSDAPTTQSLRRSLR